MTSAISSDELRSLVREVLRDVLPAQGAAPAAAPHTAPEPVATSVTQEPAAPSGGPSADAPGGAETVVLATDADLDAFVRRLLVLFENPRHRQDLRHGRLRFRLAASGSTAATASPTRQPVVRVERGAVTERQVRDAARAGARIVAARSAVVTPLARDRARALGVDIDKER